MIIAGSALIVSLIYDECWLVDRYNEHKPIAQCNIDESQQFMQ